MSKTFFIEPLEEKEKEFLKAKYQTSSKNFMRVMNWFLISCGAIPLAVSILYGIISGDMEVFIYVFIIGFCFMILFFMVISSIFYFTQVYNIYRDAKHHFKVVELCHITQKKYMELNNSYHFYLDSEAHYSIEVNKTEFEQYEVSDEINIEYSQYTKEFFGYY